MDIWKKIPVFCLLPALLALTGCEISGTRKSNKSPTNTRVDTPGVPRDVRITWAANREAAVNTAGGGYIVYYSTTPGFSIPSATFVDVPYAGGATTPTEAILPSLSSRTTYYVRVVPYSALNPQGSSSAQLSVAVP